MAAPDDRTFFVESYVPNLDPSTAAALSSRLRTAVAELHREGVILQWVRSFAFVDEETYVWIAKAADAGDVARVNQRAGLQDDHVAEVITLEPLPIGDAEGQDETI